MHIYFSGIGGGGIGPLATIAKHAGYDVSGSDKQESKYTDYLKEQGISLHIGQTTEQIAAVHAQKSIDWLVHSSAIPRDHPELRFAQENGIKHTKRDELLNKIITDHKLKLIAIAGTHGKTTTTAMAIWLFRQLNLPVSFSVGAKISFGRMGEFDPESEYFIYECDEFDRNFLAFHPYLSLITGITWDHHEIFPTQENYYQAFRDFINQSQHTILWQDEFDRVKFAKNDTLSTIQEDDPQIDTITLPGLVNRQNAWEVVQAVHRLTDRPVDELIGHVSKFPGLKQRMEKLAPNIYTNYAHTPEKIAGGMGVALELAKPGQNIVVLYEPLTNRRQHFMKDGYKDCFKGATKLYWLPTYLAREDPDQVVLTPQELIPHLSDPSIAEPAEANDEFAQKLKQHLQNGDMIVAMAPSGAGSLDEWLRQHTPELTT